MKTGTDDLPVFVDGRAYKKLTKKSDFSGNPLSSVGNKQEGNHTFESENDDLDNSLEMVGLDAKNRVFA
jgi:hypothetical protein